MTQNQSIPRYATIIRLVIDEDGLYYVAEHPELERCFSDGQTVEEALANLQEVTEMLLEHLREHHLPIPSPRPLFISPQELSPNEILPVQGSLLNEPSIQVQPVPA